MKKFLAFLLSFAMICSMMTVVTFANSESNETVEENENVIALELVELDDEQLATLSYVPFSSGVYRFDSLYNVDMCMTVEDGEYTSGACVLQCLNDGNSRETLFKVEHAGYGNIPATSQNADYYVIRSMVNSEIGLTAAPIVSGSNAVTLQTLDADNDNQMWTQYWVHMEDSGCDMWMNAATGTCLGVPDTSTNGADLEMTNSTTNAWWQLVEYTGPVIEDIVFTSSTSSIYVGGYCTFSAYLYSSRIGVNGPVQFEVLDLDGTPTDIAEIHPISGFFEPLREGNVDVYACSSNEALSESISITIDGFATADLAALGFAREIYASSLYILHEYGATIYTTINSGVTIYHYSSPVWGTPHSVSLSGCSPSVYDSSCVATIHTHPNQIGFSGTDTNNAVLRNRNSYVVCPDFVVYKYDISTLETTGIGSFEPDALTDEEKESLEEAFELSWSNHVNEGACSFGCETKTWPNG